MAETDSSIGPDDAARIESALDPRASRTAPFRFGEWRAQPSLNELIGPDAPVRVEPRVMEVLICLAQARGQVVTRDEFMERVWSNMVVTDDVLARCISELRKILGDPASEPKYIETIRKSGYRLLPAVDFDETADDPVPWGPPLILPTTAPARRRLQPWAWVLIGGGFIVPALLFYHFVLNTPPSQPQVVPFTSLPGEEVDPALSPDGESVVFAWNEGVGEAFDLYIKQAGGDALLRLTEVPGKESDPTWAPDGRQIAFVRQNNGSSAIYLVPSLGGGEREIATFADRNVQGLVWSPSGDALAFSAQHASYSGYRIYVLSIETLAVREVTRPPEHFFGDTSPTFSPDHSRLAFVRAISPPIQDIYTIPLDGGEPTQLTHDYTQITGIHWEPGGRHVLYGSLRGGNSNLWRIGLLGGGPEWVATAGDNAIVRHPSTDESGSTLAFERRTAYANIWKLNRSSPPQPLIISTRWDSDPAISPDGSRIAYVSNQSGAPEIWIADAEGANAFQRTEMGGRFLSTPRWSPDGASLAFVSWHEGNADIFRIEAAGGLPQPIAATDANEIAPAWARNGRAIYYASNANDRWCIVKAALPARVDTTTAPPPDSLAHPPIDSVYVVTEGVAAMESEDGAALYLMKPNEAGIWRYYPDTDSAAIVVHDVLPVDSGNWSVVGNGLYFIDRSSRRPAIAYFSFTTRRITPIAYLGPLPDDNAFAVSADGRWFLYTQIERSESDILLIEGR